jgi:hypothetical protein
MTNALKWLGLVLTLSGALSTAMGWYNINIYLLNAGSVAYLAWSFRVKDLNLILVNSGLLLIYVAGIVRLMVI